MEVVYNQTFVDDTIVLDGRNFVNCTFINCLLIFAGGHFEWTNPTRVNCRWKIAGDALETTRFMAMIATLDPASLPVLPTDGIMPDSPSA